LYYTIEETDLLLNEFYDKNSIDFILTEYYKKDETYNKLEVYNKTETDLLLGNYFT